MDNGKQVYSSIHTLMTEAITLEGIWCKLEDDRVSHNGANRVCYLEASAHFNLLDKSQRILRLAKDFIPNKPTTH
jgi:hypothetical protein